MKCETTNCCETTITQQSINDRVSFTYENGVLTLIVGNRIFNIPLEINSGGGGSFNGEELVIPVVSNGQTNFSNIIPTGKTIFALFINGIKENKTSYNITGNVNLSWLGPYILETSDSVTAWLTDI